jgi:hypothetical protein
MASKPPGVSDSTSNPGFGNARGLTGFGTLTPPGPTGPHTSLQDVERRLAELAHRFSSAIGWREKRSAAYELLGQHSFTAGVVWGMGENLTQTVVASVELVEVLALAEYWESKQNHTLMGQIRANAFFAIAPGVSVGMTMAGQFWPGFDRKAKEAFEERGAIIDAIKVAFMHPKDFLGSLTKAQEAKAKDFVALLGEKSLSGNFHAGKLMGELLFDLLMAIDLVVGLAKLVAALPRLARYAEDLANLAREFRAAKQLETKASDLAEPGPRITQAQKDAAQASTRGGSPPPAPTAAATGPGSAAHKAARWQEYQDRGGEWPYDRWSNVYDSNVTRARLANQATDAYHDTLGWGEREVTVTSNVDGVDYARRLDIADQATLQGVEYKTGYQTATQDNLWEIARDKALQDKAGWSIKWVFRDSASQPLQDALTEAGIDFSVGP